MVFVRTLETCFTLWRPIGVTVDGISVGGACGLLRAVCSRSAGPGPSAAVRAAFTWHPLGPRSRAAAGRPDVPRRASTAGQVFWESGLAGRGTQNQQPPYRAGAAVSRSLGLSGHSAPRLPLSPWCCSDAGLCCGSAPGQWPGVTLTVHTASLLWPTATLPLPQLSPLLFLGARRAARHATPPSPRWWHSSEGKPRCAV